MIVVSIIYPCNFGCPLCPYTDENSDLRRFYRERGGDFLPVDLWRRMADEAGEYGSFLRCTGGGEPLMHPHMVEMAEYARQQGARLWINTNGSMFGPDAQGRGASRTHSAVRDRPDRILHGRGRRGDVRAPASSAPGAPEGSGPVVRGPRRQHPRRGPAAHGTAERHPRGGLPDPAGIPSRTGSTSTSASTWRTSASTKSSRGSS